MALEDVATYLSQDEWQCPGPVQQDRGGTHCWRAEGTRGEAPAAVHQEPRRVSDGGSS